MRDKTKKALSRITDIFTGADGGGSFAVFRAFLDELDQQAQTGDEDAEKIIEIVHRFDRMCQVPLMSYHIIT